LAFEDVVRLLDLARLLNRLGCDGTQANGLQEIHALFFEFVEADFLVVGSQVFGGSEHHQVQIDRALEKVSDVQKDFIRARCSIFHDILPAFGAIEADRRFGTQRIRVSNALVFEHRLFHIPVRVLFDQELLDRFFVVLMVQQYGFRLIN